MSEANPSKAPARAAHLWFYPVVFMCLAAILWSGWDWLRGRVAIGFLDDPLFLATLQKPGFFNVYLAMQIACGCVALFAAALCLIHFHTTGDLTTPLMGIGLLLSGLLDFCQMGAGFMLSHGQQSTAGLLLGWTVSRGFYLLIIIVACTLFMLGDRVRSREHRLRALRIIGGVGLVFLAVTAAVAYLFSAQPAWSVALYGVGFRRMAWNLAPLLLTVVAAAYVLPTYATWQKGVFSRALWLSCLPLALSQLFFSAGMRDVTANLFLLANLFKLIAYACPLVGLMQDYKATYQRLDGANRELRNRLFLFEQTKDVGKQGQRVLEGLLQTVQLPVCVLDTSLRVTTLNETHAALSALASPAAALGKTTSEVWGAGPAARLQGAAQNALQSNEPVHCQLEPYLYPDGRSRRMDWLIRPILNEHGRAVAVVCVGGEV